jgi:DNA excision repair protein ERCC-1
MSKVVVNSNQTGNPLLQFLKNAPWEHGPTLADYSPTRTCAVLYLSLNYHHLHPEYIEKRVTSIQGRFKLLVLLVVVDVALFQLIAHTTRI